MNAYKVDGYGVGYLIILAKSPGQARADYIDEVGSGSDFTMPMSIKLIEKDVECASVREYVESRYFDLLFAGVIDPEWYELSFL